MTQKEFFGKALWLTADSFPEAETARGGASHFPILRSEIDIPEGITLIKATLRAVGLGYFLCYFNGKRVGDSEYLPIYSDFEPREFPIGEKLTGHRIYVPEFDVTNLLENGKNSIVIHAGGGWYTHGYRPGEVYGDAKAIWSLTVETAEGTLKYYSLPENTRATGESFIKKYHFAYCEHQDFSSFDEGIYARDYGSLAMPAAVPAKPLSDETVYDMTDCPTDKIIKRLTAVKIAEKDGVSYYDAGENTTGFTVIRVNAPKGERVTVRFSEEREEDGTLNENFVHKQTFSVVSDGKKRIARPYFTWFGFRYFSLEGDAELISVDVVYTDIKRASSFECDDETLNWLYKAFMDTQACNLHGGIPSDCPHLERRGYTGDGQLACRTVMQTFDAQKLYMKWLCDISDCQDSISGHVQYAAPYARCGGGPGGWGSAIVEVPYRYHLNYNNIGIIRMFYPKMKKYLEFLEAHSENDLVISDVANVWCLGDWATPESVVLPAPYVNGYFYVKSIMKMIEMAPLAKCADDIPQLEALMERKKRALTNAYFNKWDGNFLGGVQGANAFAVDIGIGDGRTYPNMVEYYRKNTFYDTGIFGTELVTRLLFERGDGDLAVELMTSGKDTHTFEAMRRRGATTLWEYFPGSLCDRSHSHPMFGGVVALFFEYLLGIKYSVADGALEISPALSHKLCRVSGSRRLPEGEVTVSYVREGDAVSACITLPSGLGGKFIWKETEISLKEGENLFSVSLQTENILK